ncbi:MAG: FHA domain-containing protein [Chloroflexota bacterium]
MISCPSCKNTEYEGTLYCSECGVQLWTLMGDEGDEDTAALKRRSQIQREQAALADPPDSRPTAPAAGEIIVKIHGLGEQLRLTGQTSYLLGRADPRQQVIPDADMGPFGGQHMGVSRRHATLQHDAAGVTLTDLGSANGTMVNGRTLEASETVHLKDGDEITLGRLVLNVYFVNE